MTHWCGPVLRYGRLRFYLGGAGNVPPYHTIFFQREYSCLTIRPDDVVLDAGANAGLFSIWAASKCRSVVAVEPAPETFNLLRLNKKINNATNVLLINKALSDHEGYVRMGGEGGTFRIEQGGIIVPSTTIDSLLSDLDLSVDVVKMDVEGAERVCLAGSYLQHVREIVVETNSTEVVKMLEGHGFRTTKINFRVSHTIANVLKKLPYFLSTELATNFMVSRSTLNAFTSHHPLLAERFPGYQIIHAYKT